MQICCKNVLKLGKVGETEGSYCVAIKSNKKEQGRILRNNLGYLFTNFTVINGFCSEIWKKMYWMTIIFCDKMKVFPSFQALSLSKTTSLFT